MLQRRQSPAITKPVNQMAAVVRHFLEDDGVPAELVEFAVAKAVAALREVHWTPGRIRTYCARVVAVEAALLERRARSDRLRWLRATLPGWLDSCLDGDDRLTAP